MCRGFEPDTIYVGGGGGDSKTGVPNTIKVFKLQEGSLKLMETRTYEHVVSAIAICASRTRYIAIGHGSEMVLASRKFEKIGEFQTEMKKLFFRSLDFSFSGRKLLMVDGDDVFRLLAVPDCRVLGQSRFARAVFHENDIIAAVFGSIQLLKSDSRLTKIAEIKCDNLNPRSLFSLGPDFFVSFVDGQRKSWLKHFQVQKRKLELIREKNCEEFITALMGWKEGLSFCTNDGDVVVMNKQFKNARKVKNVHGLPVTSAIKLGDFVATGGLDSCLMLTPLEVKSPVIRKILIPIFLFLISILVFVLRNKRK
jgi:hypothetical protein